MSQVTLQSLLGHVQKQVFDDAKAGKTPQSGWDEAAKLPLTQEYRVRVDSSKLAPSKAGNLQFTLTFEVLEPAEYKGAKFQDYQNPAPTNTMGSEMLSKFYGALQADLDESHWNGDMDAFGAQFTDKTVVVAIRRWGDDPSDMRTGIRWYNLDKGQALKSNITPQGGRPGASSALKPDVVLPKPAETPTVVVAQPAQPTDQPAADSAPAPTASPSLPPGVNLPPGLR